MSPGGPVERTPRSSPLFAPGMPGPAATAPGAPGQPALPTQKASAAQVPVAAGIAIVLAILHRI